MLTTSTEQVASPRSATLARLLRRPGVGVESAALLLSPLVVVWPLRAQLWATTFWIDPFLHTAVIEHGRDLLERFGPNNRQFARAGMVVPGRLFNAAFGDIPGYLLFRYALALCAVIPAYLLFRRLHGRAAGAVVVAAILANPVVLRAWGSDYGDCSAVAYLIGGTCALVMPAATRRARLRWVAGGATLLCLAMHSIMVTIPLVAAVVLVYLALMARRSPRQAFIDLAVVIAALAVTTGVLVVASKLLFNVADIFSPTWRAYLRLRQPVEVALWHTPGRRWALADPYLLVPPAVIAAWCVVRLGRNVPPAELAIAGAAALQTAAFGYLQFVNTEQTLEFYLYSSLLWPAVVLVGAFTVVGMARPLLRRPATAWVPAAVVLLVPLAVHPFRTDLFFRVAPIGLLVALLIVALCAAATVAVVRRRALPVVALTLAVVAGSYVLVTGKDPHTPWLPGQIHYPSATYASVIDTPYGPERNVYGVASQLHHVVPPPTRPGTPVMMWLPPRPSEAVNITAAQYGWDLYAVNRRLPALPSIDVALIRQRHPDYILLLSDTGEEFAAGLRALHHYGLDLSVARRATLRYGHLSVAVLVVSIDSGPVDVAGRSSA